jgi:hypothetical protein
MYVYFMTIWDILGPFGLVCSRMVYFFPFWYVWIKKNLATLLKTVALIEQRFICVLQNGSATTSHFLRR